MTETRELEPRLAHMENELVLLRSGQRELREWQTTLVTKNGEMIQNLTGAFGKALELASNSLSIPLLKDVLVPLVMRLFTFFAVLVLVLLGAILGIKWAIGDLLKMTGI